MTSKSWWFIFKRDWRVKIGCLEIYFLLAYLLPSLSLIISFIYSGTSSLFFKFSIKMRKHKSLTFICCLYKGTSQIWKKNWKIKIKIIFSITMVWYLIYWIKIIFNFLFIHTICISKDGYFKSPLGRVSFFYFNYLYI